jgi:hypothetical protein
VSTGPDCEAAVVSDEAHEVLARHDDAGGHDDTAFETA